MWLYSIYKLCKVCVLNVAEDFSYSPSPFGWGTVASVVAHSSGLIGFKHICVSSYMRCKGALACTSRPVHAHHSMLLSQAFSSFHVALVISVSSVWHANEVSILMLEHYRHVCLIPLLPFLFLEIILFLNGIGIFRFTQLPFEPAGWSDSQPTIHSLIQTPLPFKCFQRYDGWLKQPLFASLDACLWECVRCEYV